MAKNGNGGGGFVKGLFVGGTHWSAFGAAARPAIRLRDPCGAA